MNIRNITIIFIIAKKELSCYRQKTKNHYKQQANYRVNKQKSKKYEKNRKVTKTK